MAENIFTKGAWKKYRTAARQYAKQKNRSDYKRQMLTMTGTLAQEESHLQAEENKLAAIKKSLDAEHTRLDNLCQSPLAQEKIRNIATGILRKNSKIAAKFESCNKQLQESKQQLNRAKMQLNAVKQRLGREINSAKYRITSSIGVRYASAQKSTAQERASIIANALLGDPQAARLIANATDSSMEMDKTWELMTELDKDEVKMRALRREI